MNKIEPPAPGVYRGVPAETYHAWDAMNASTIKRAAKSMAHLRHTQTQPPDPPSDAMVLGSAMHTLLFEPHRFDELYVAQPDSISVRRGKLWESFCVENADKSILRPSDMPKLLDMVKRIEAVGVARDSIAACEGMYEVSLVWRDPSTGILCKARPDGLMGGAEWDDPKGPRKHLSFKTSGVDVGPESFPRQFFNMMYHVSDAWYCWGLDCLGRPDGDLFGCRVVAVEPGDVGVAVYDVDDQTLGAGRQLFRHWLDIYNQCLRDDVWPGYSDTVMKLQIPDWALRKIEEGE